MKRVHCQIYIRFKLCELEYLPVSPEEIRERTVFDEEHQTYPRAPLRCDVPDAPV